MSGGGVEEICMAWRIAAASMFWQIFAQIAQDHLYRVYEITFPAGTECDVKYISLSPVRRLASDAESRSDSQNRATLKLRSSSGRTSRARQRIRRTPSIGEIMPLLSRRRRFIGRGSWWRRSICRSYRLQHWWHHPHRREQSELVHHTSRDRVRQHTPRISPKSSSRFFM